MKKRTVNMDKDRILFGRNLGYGPRWDIFDVNEMSHKELLEIRERLAIERNNGNVILYIDPLLFDQLVDYATELESLIEHTIGKGWEWKD